MMPLATLQQEFTQAVFSATGSDSQSINQRIQASKGPSAEQRVAIYRAAILGSLCRVLEEVYPVINRLLGDEFFQAMARRYAQQIPSLQPDLNEYGRELNEFLSNFEPVKAMHYLPDVAQLEWYWHEIFSEVDETPADFSVLARLDEATLGRVTFRLPKAARLMRSEFPIARIWATNQPDCEEETTIDLAEGADHLLIWRQGHEQRIEHITENQWQLLSAIEQGLGFQSLIETLDLDEDITRMFPEFVQRGWVSGLDI